MSLIRDKYCKHDKRVVYHPDGQTTLRTLKGERVRQWICEACGKLLQTDTVQRQSS